ncbi:MAG: galactose-1-phosphate uridylyltransferase [Candidatus Omnitrophica bacterium]|nr:galactose-1-phosphate uridylyltransferase [Candidatus Omnitrophota bacterium]
MPELRKDPVIGRWVIIATERAKRPEDFKVEKETASQESCPFCQGSEKHTPAEVFAVRKSGTLPNQPGWDVRVVSSIAPLLQKKGVLKRRGKGIYDLMNAIGAHEVIVETPEHIGNIADLPEGQIVKIVDCYVERFSQLQKDKRFKYVLMFKNYGQAAGGGSLQHSRSQLIATPVDPKRVKEELVGSRRYFEYKERCIFCDIISQELQLGQRVIAEVGDLVAVSPFASRFPFEVWILPKGHSCDFFKITPEQRRDFARVLKIVMLKLKVVLNDPPYNYVLHTAPFRRAKRGYWKTISEDYHWHLEIMPRLTRVAGFEWGTGFYLNPTSPEEAAKILRETKL